MDGRMGRWVGRCGSCGIERRGREGVKKERQRKGKAGREILLLKEPV